jgi:sugar lactone lactonase YvrE
VAGNGTPSLSGDGGQAAFAQLGNPYGVAVDATGDQYIVDNQNAVIRKIDPTGVIKTVAGNGTPGFAGEGGPATAAELMDPRGVAVDANGNVYIADTGNQRIRKVDHSTGNIITIAGNGTAGFSGDNGPGAGAMINYPRGVAVDAAGNVYFADTVNNRVRVIAPSGVISTFAGNGTAGFAGDGATAVNAELNAPRGVVVDGSGNVLITDTGNNRVRRVDHATGVITTIAGNGTAGSTGDGSAATKAELSAPFGVAVDGGGNVFIADTGNQRIRVVNHQGLITTVVAACGAGAGFSGDGGWATGARLNSPLGIAVDVYGNLYIADVNNNRVRGAYGMDVRGASCQGPAGTAASRSDAQAPAGSPGSRIDRALTPAIPELGSRPAKLFLPTRAIGGSAPAAAKRPVPARPVLSAPTGSAPDAREAAVESRPVGHRTPAMEEPGSGSDGSFYIVLLALLLPVCLALVAWHRSRSPDSD